MRLCKFQLRLILHRFEDHKYVPSKIIICLKSVWNEEPTLCDVLVSGYNDLIFNLVMILKIDSINITSNLIIFHQVIWCQPMPECTMITI